jgi:hypothetical protein
MARLRYREPVSAAASNLPPAKFRNRSLTTLLPTLRGIAPAEAARWAFLSLGTFF